MKRFIPFAIVAGLLVSGLALATYIIPHASPEWFKASIWIGRLSTTTNSTTNRITGTYATTQSWDFPPLSASALQTACSETGAFTLTGAQIGDICEVRDNTGMDGGVLSTINAGLSCRVSAANAVVVKACISGMTDGGIIDLTDAGYNIRIWSNQ